MKKTQSYTATQEITINALINNDYYKTITKSAIKTLAKSRQNGVGDTCREIMQGGYIDPICEDLEQEIYITLFRLAIEDMLIYNPINQKAGKKIVNTKVVDIDRTWTNKKTNEKVVYTTKALSEITEYTDNIMGEFIYKNELSDNDTEKSSYFRVFRTIENYINNQRKNEGYRKIIVKTKDGNKEYKTISPLRVDLYIQNDENSTEISINNSDYAKYLNLSYDMDINDILYNEKFDISYIVNKYLEKNPKDDIIIKILSSRLAGFKYQQIADKYNIQLRRVKYLISKFGDFIISSQNISEAFKTSINNLDMSASCAFPIKPIQPKTATKKRVVYKDGTTYHTYVNNRMVSPKNVKIIRGNKTIKLNSETIYNRDARIQFWKNWNKKQSEIEKEYFENTKNISDNGNIEYTKTNDFIIVSLNGNTLHKIPIKK